MTDRAEIMKHLKNSIRIVSIILLFNSCSTLKIVKQDRSSIVAISATSSGFSVKGYGILITLENIDTYERYKSQSFSSISPHSAIQNIPQGRYFVQKVEIPIGNIIYSNWSEDVKTFFGQINIEPSSKYYLGDFTASVKIGIKNVLKLQINNQNIPEKIKEKIELGKTGWSEGEFIKLYPHEEKVLWVY